MIVNYSDEQVIKGKKSIFLAGPTPREEDIVSWRNEAVEKLKEYGFDGVVYVPEYSTWKPKADYTDQTLWERYALTEATVIMFWIPRSLPDMPAFTTNVEFGYWLNTGKVTYGRPNGAKKTKYLDWLYEYDYNKKYKETLDDLIKESIELANTLYDPLTQARLFCKEVKELSNKFNLPFFVVTQGASSTSNNGCEAVKHARDKHIEWEKENGFDPNEDWSK